VNQLASAIVRDATEPDDEFSLTLDFSQVTIEGMQFVSDVIEVGEVSEVTIRN
jgi:hypothetical protein